MSNYNKKCLLCGKEFKFCPTCQQKGPAEAWKNIFDKEECRTIFHLACDYAQNEVDADTAKSILAKCDLSNKDSYKPDIRRFIDNIIGSPDVKEKVVDDKTEEYKKTESSNDNANNTYRKDNFKKRKNNNK